MEKKGGRRGKGNKSWRMIGNKEKKNRHICIYIDTGKLTSGILSRVCIRQRRVTPYILHTYVCTFIHTPVASVLCLAPTLTVPPSP